MSDKQTKKSARFFAWFPATFIRQVGTKGIAFVQPRATSTCGEHEFAPLGTGRGFVKITLKRMKPSDHAPKIDVAECSQCGAIQALGQPCGEDPPWVLCPQSRDATSAVRR